MKVTGGGVSREVAAIWDERTTPKGKEYLVEWLGLPERTWEREENVRRCTDALRSYQGRRRAAKKAQGASYR